MTYCFRTPFPSDHFVSRYIAYASQRTDAAHDYHEAAALVLLASASPGVKFWDGPWASGLPTNLYVILIGDSTRSRKSTSLDYAAEILDEAIPGCQLPSQMTPEAFVEQMAARSHKSAAWIIDEFGELYSRIQRVRYMEGMRKILLESYNGKTFAHTRHSKRIRGGGSEEDTDYVVNPHLSILGASTAVLFEDMKPRDLFSGVLPRFGIVMPDTKPAHRPFYELALPDSSVRNGVVLGLREIHEWINDARPTISFESGALDQIDRWTVDAADRAHLDGEQGQSIMVNRLQTMAVKIAMLSAIGRPENVARAHLTGTQEDSDAAIEIVERWRNSAFSFISEIGASHLETHISRVEEYMRLHNNVASRTEVARLLRRPAREINDVESTMLDRGLIEVDIDQGTGGRPRVEWRLTA